ncbi:MAG: hypothetical protein JOZ41_12490 [Chloroflexi bacterium]|nr:hypothetical protein [Chloroflexota bacterium]
MLIGTVVKSNSHISYLCRVYGKLETESPPGPDDFAFGTFVTLAPVESGLTLVGVIRDTLLLNPDYGNLGPRLSSGRDLAVFSPDYLNEKGVLVDVLVLGWLQGGRAHHMVPALAAQVGTQVETMPEELVHAFHRDSRGRFLIGYLPLVVSRNDPMVAGLLLTILQRLEPAFPAQRRVIGVLKNNLAWKARVVPAG